MARRNIYIHDETWEVLQRQAADEGARQGRTVSVSEWIRLLADREQERQVRRERRAAER